MTARAVRVTGVDLSLTSTGIARLTVAPDGTLSTWTTTVGRSGEAGEPLAQRWRRLDALVTAIDEQVAAPDLVVIEAPSMASQFGHPHDRSGGWWLLVDRLMSRGLAIAEVPPLTLKVWATGSGTTRGPEKVTKSHVREAVRRTYGHLFDITGHDVADATALATIGGAYLCGAPLVALPDTHTRALAAVRWPVQPTGVLL